MTGAPLADIEIQHDAADAAAGPGGACGNGAEGNGGWGASGRRLADRSAATWLEARTETLAAGPAGRRATAMPAIRARADSLGIDLAQIRGGGPGGAIGLEDVEQAGRAALGPRRYKPLAGVRRSMAQIVARAREVTPCTVTDEADVGRWPEGTDVTVRLIRALVAGCEAAPILNSWCDAARLSAIQHDSIDLGLTINVAQGLFVPVLRDVAGRSDADLRRTIDGLKQNIARRVLPPAEMRGPTITLSNFGAFGGRHAELVVLPPQVAALGAGRIVEAVRPIGGQPGVTKVLPLSITFDHRMVTGFEAVTFLNAVVCSLEA